MKARMYLWLCFKRPLSPAAIGEKFLSFVKPLIASRKKKSWSVWKGKDTKQIGRQNYEVYVFSKISDWLQLEQALFLWANSSGKDEICKGMRNMLRRNLGWEVLELNFGLFSLMRQWIIPSNQHSLPENGTRTECAVTPLEINNYSGNGESQSIKQIRYCRQIAICK